MTVFDKTIQMNDTEIGLKPVCDFFQIKVKYQNQKFLK
jgi:hypothetical protein